MSSGGIRSTFLLSYTELDARQNTQTRYKLHHYLYTISCRNYSNNQKTISQLGAVKGRFIFSIMAIILGSSFISSNPISDNVM